MVRRSTIHTFLGILVIALILAACGNDTAAPARTAIMVSQTPGAAPTVESAKTATPVLGLTSLPPEATAAVATPTDIPTLAPSQYEPTVSVPPELNLSGKLIFTDYRLGIGQFDFSTGEIVSLYRPPDRGYVGSAMLSPDGRTLLISYSPPPDPNNTQYVPTSSLYTLPADGSSEPSPLLGNAGSGEYYFAPWWSPDGQYVYYGRYISPFSGMTPVPGPTGYFLTRYTYPDGPAQDVLTDVLAARLSADGTRMFYVSINMNTLFSNIYVATPDGSNLRSLLPGGDYWIIDSLAVAPDGESVVYSSASSDPPPPPKTSWLDKLLGVQVTEAHNVLSDLFLVKEGQEPQQITHLAGFGFVQDFSPDGQYVVFSYSGGVYIMRPDGSGQTQIISEPIFGTLQWVP